MATAHPVSERAIEVDEDALAQALWGRALAVRHSLAGNPLFSLETVAGLADSLPARAIERHSSEQPLVLPGGAPELSGPPSETVLGIETNGCWMVLWNIEQDPRYRAVLDEVLDWVQHRLPRSRDAAMRRREAFLFLSAPSSVTPVHFDPEHNLLLQIRGRKTISVGSLSDADQRRELERYYDGGHRNLERIPTHSQAFEMAPGDGVYVWPFAPHWVENGPEASISLSITWRSRRSERDERIEAMNARLRRHGRTPKLPGASPSIDRIKGGLVGAVHSLRGLADREPHISR